MRLILWTHPCGSVTLKYVDAIEGVVKGFSFKTVSVERL
jgi:hypothetical protein